MSRRSFREHVCSIFVAAASRSKHGFHKLAHSRCECRAGQSRRRAGGSPALSVLRAQKPGSSAPSHSNLVPSDRLFQFGVLEALYSDEGIKNP
jgi:hypothetical protein